MSTAGDRDTGHDGTPPAGAFTTIWSLPCGPLTDVQYADDSFVEWAPTPLKTLPSSCGPPGWNAAPNSGSPPDRIAYYSPAICPSGYTVACSWYLTAQGPVPSVTENAYNCLPTGYECTSTNYIDGEATDAPAFLGSGFAPMIPIRWADSDLTILETHPLTPGLTLATTTSDSSAPTTTPPGPPAPGDSLSKGAIAGIVIGAILGLLLLAAAVFFLWKRRAAAGRARNMSDAMDQPEKRELDGKELPLREAQEIDSERVAPLVEAPGWTGLELSSEAPGKGAWPQGMSELPADASLQPRQQVVPPDIDMPSSEGKGSSLADATTVYSWAAPAGPSAQPKIVSSVAEEPSSSAVLSEATREDGDELAQLRKRQAQIEQSRQRLMQLQQLDEEEEMVRRRIGELEKAK